MSLLLIFFVKSVGAWPNDFSFIYSLTRLKQVTGISHRYHQSTQTVLNVRKWSMKNAEWMNTSGCNAIQEIYLVSCKVSLYLYVRFTVGLAKRQLLSFCIYGDICFGERYISFRIFTALNFSFQHSVKINSKSHFSCRLQRQHQHRAWTCSFSFGIFVINEQENWRVVFEGSSAHAIPCTGTRHTVQLLNEWHRVCWPN